MTFSAFLHHGWQSMRALLSVLVLLFLGDLLWTLGRFPALTRHEVFTLASLPASQDAVLILGAGVYGRGEPTRVLKARLRMALALYQAGKVRWFLVSGDNREPSYNEPQAMRRWLLRKGVPPTRIVSDYAGRRTWDSLKRAQVVFGLRRVVVVTSDFHLPRALFLADHMGLEALGVPASTEHQPLSAQVRFWVREYFARHLALVDVWFPPDPMLGPREPTPDDWEPAS